MSDILDNFIQKSKENVASGYYDLPNGFRSSGVKGVSLKKTLEASGFSLISEIKHASPAGEYSFIDIDAETAAMTFLKNGADAISCVVEPQVFKGRLSNIPLAKKSGLPVLFKDFVISEKQIEAAHAYGADAVLLVVKVCRRLGLDMASLIESAHSHSLEVLLESYDVGEMNEAMVSDADILGINNRDLQTLVVDLNRTRRIMSDVGSVGRPVISESGIKAKADAEFVKGCGVRGILVGTALWKAKDLGAKIRELKIK